MRGITPSDHPLDYSWASTFGDSKFQIGRNKRPKDFIVAQWGYKVDSKYSSFAFIPTLSALAMWRHPLHGDLPASITRPGVQIHPELLKGPFEQNIYIDSEPSHISLSQDTQEWLYAKSEIRIEGSEVVYHGTQYRLRKCLANGCILKGWRVSDTKAVEISSDGVIRIKELAPKQFRIFADVYTPFGPMTVAKDVRIVFPGAYLTVDYIGDEPMIRASVYGNQDNKYGLTYEWGYSRANTPGIIWEESLSSVFHIIRGDLEYTEADPNSIPQG